MGAKANKSGAFEKVGPCLYRYVPTGVYYARIKRKSKGVRRSLDTDDRATAKRKLADLHRKIDRTEAEAGRATLVSLRDRYLTTVQDQENKILKRKRYIAARFKANFPGGADVPAGKVLPSQLSAWLASYKLDVDIKVIAEWQGQQHCRAKVF